MKYLARKCVLQFGDVVLPRAEHTAPTTFEATLAEIGPASLASVRRALRVALGRTAGISPTPDYDMAELKLSVVTENGAGEETTVDLCVTTSGELVVDVQIGVQPTTADDEETAEEKAIAQSLETLVAGFCRSQGVELREVFRYYYRHFPAFIFHASFVVKQRGANVEQAVRVATALVDLSQAFLSNEHSHEAFVLATLRSGRPDLLLGLYESGWLECKSQGYDLKVHSHRIELAQDVARFANSERGGLLVLGLKTKKDSAGDRIVSVHPLPTPRTASYHKALDSLLFPPIEALNVEAVTATPGGEPAIILVLVPPQPEELKPFLVTGAIVGDRVEGAFISIVRRRGEHSIPISAPAIHASLAAGRALLRFGVASEHGPDRSQTGG
jgi:hypothetical protein